MPMIDLIESATVRYVRITRRMAPVAWAILSAFAFSRAAADLSPPAALIGWIAWQVARREASDLESKDANR